MSSEMSFFKSALEQSAWKLNSIPMLQMTKLVIKRSVQFYFQTVLFIFLTFSRSPLLNPVLFGDNNHDASVFEGVSVDEGLGNGL